MFALEGFGIEGQVTKTQNAQRWHPPVEADTKIDLRPVAAEAHTLVDGPQRSGDRNTQPRSRLVLAAEHGGGGKIGYLVVSRRLEHKMSGIIVGAEANIVEISER